MGSKRGEHRCEKLKEMRSRVLVEAWAVGPHVARPRARAHHGISSITEEWIFSVVS